MATSKSQQSFLTALMLSVLMTANYLFTGKDFLVKQRLADKLGVFPDETGMG
jgi:hypothetical protein